MLLTVLRKEAAKPPRAQSRARHSATLKGLDGQKVLAIFTGRVYLGVGIPAGGWSLFLSFPSQQVALWLKSSVDYRANSLLDWTDWDFGIE